MKRILLCSFFFLILLCGCAAQSNNAERLAPLDISKAFNAYDNNECSKSIQIFSEADNLQKNPIILNGLGMSYLQCKQPENAVKVFREAVSLVPNSAALQANLGIAYYENNQIAEAKEKFKLALELDPQLMEAVIGDATILIHEKQPEKALKILFDFAQNYPDEPIIKYNEAIAFYEMGMYADSIKLLQEYTAQIPDDAYAWNALAVAQQKNNRFDDALASIDKAIALYPVDGYFYYNKGNILKDKNKYVDADKEYSRAISFLPELAEAYVNRGDIRFLLRKTKEGCEDLQKACSLGSCERLEIYKDAGRCLGGIWK